MSFQAAQQEVQEFILNSRYAFPKFESINAMLDARRLNTTILEGPTEKDGKLRKIKISHYPADCNIVDDNCTATICGTGTKDAPVQEWFLISKCIQSKKRTLAIADVRKVGNNGMDGADYSFTDHAKAQILSGMFQLNRELAIEIDASLLAHKGLHLNGNSEVRITMSNTSSGLMTPLGLWEIEKEFSDGGYINPFVLGVTEVFNWKKALGIASVNATLGQDFAKLGDTNMYYDTVLNSVVGVTTGGEYVIAFDPQALKFVTFSENVGLFATEIQPSDLDNMYKRGGTDYSKGVFRDPTTGIFWDFFLNFDKCDGDEGSFTWFMRLKWDIFYPRIESCNKQGVNGIFLYKTCPVVIPTCPTGDTPSPAVSSRTYTWTPPNVYPLLVGEITIGGIQSYPNSNVSTIAQLASALNDAYGLPIFSQSASNIIYTGYSAITGEINVGNITITFA